jgi:hypothetical protein
MLKPPLCGGAMGVNASNASNSGDDSAGRQVEMRGAMQFPGLMYQTHQEHLPDLAYEGR